MPGVSKPGPWTLWLLQLPNKPEFVSRHLFPEVLWCRQWFGKLAKDQDKKNNNKQKKNLTRLYGYYSRNKDCLSAGAQIQISLCRHDCGYGGRWQRRLFLKFHINLTYNVSQWHLSFSHWLLCIFQWSSHYTIQISAMVISHLWDPTLLSEDWLIHVQTPLRYSVTFLCDRYTKRCINVYL